MRGATPYTATSCFENFVGRLSFADQRCKEYCSLCTGSHVCGGLQNGGHQGVAVAGSIRLSISA